MSIKAVSEVSHTRLRRRARYGDLFAPVLLAGWVLVGVTLAGALGGWHWWLDYFANFPVQCLGLMLPVLGLSLWRRAWRHAAVFGAVVAWNGVLVWPLVFGGVWVPPSLVHKLADKHAVLRVAQKNLLHGNPQHHETLGWLLGQRADVIVVEELTDRWRHALLSGLIGYRPFLPPRPAGEWHTVGVFVRDGLEVTSHRFWGEAEPLKPMVEVVLEAGFDEPVTVVGVHTRSPVSADWARRRDHQLTELAAWSRGHGGPLVIAGDLNATRWSAPMRAWSRAGRLRDTAEGAGLWGTWPGFWAWSGMITLDHVLVSAHFANGRRRIGPGLGSDHRGVMVELMPAVLARPAG